MLFRSPSAGRDARRLLLRLDELRAELERRSPPGARWLGSLRREWRAAAAESSIEIEGFHVPAGERLALSTGAAAPAPGDRDRQALRSYAHAMDHVGVLSDDPAFRWSDRVLLDLHFDACSFQHDRRPGRWRTGGVEVTRPGGGAPAYVAPPAEDVPALIDELVGWLTDGDLDAHVAVRAAMAHLHLVSIHPWADGNGRLSRIVQSLVLARGGVLSAEFVSIEEQLGRDTNGYYGALMAVQGGAYRPERDASRWVSFCLEAHVAQAERRVTQLAMGAARWRLLEERVEGRGWPDRLVIALEHALVGGVDRATYAAEADVSAPTATTDLRRLLDAGLLVRRGQGRTTRYATAPGLRADVDRAERDAS